MQKAEGADIVLMDRAALADKFRWLKTSDLRLGAFGRTGEGWFDAHSLLGLLRNAARQKGARYIHGEVVGIARDGARVTGVTLADGERIALRHAGQRRGTAGRRRRGACRRRASGRAAQALRVRGRVPHARCPACR